MPPVVVLVPGILTPAADRYGPLVAVLGDEVHPLVKDLEVYRDGTGECTVEREVAGVLQAADAVGADRFHYVGYSAGAAVGLAVAARHPDRLLSLVVDEPPTDWSADDLGGAYWQRMHAALEVPAPDVVPTFARLQVAEDVELPAPPGPAPDWMARRPAGIAAFARAVRAAPQWATSWEAYGGPALWTGGDRSTRTTARCATGWRRACPGCAPGPSPARTTWRVRDCSTRRSTRRSSGRCGAVPDPLRAAKGRLAVAAPGRASCAA